MDSLLIRWDPSFKMYAGPLSRWGTSIPMSRPSWSRGLHHPRQTNKGLLMALPTDSHRVLPPKVTLQMGVLPLQGVKCKQTILKQTCFLEVKG
ncbi:hypothetical protein CEXT_355351 [Caerostris extrusa]|uniref:Uncharacterized protein n=1 Tax=Caerostris extrusa TaxID=172846 RepID=A0AAV4NS39_CAEEX|nr:hypothetical protein CEXT_355351 [Caerostris extrusa]